MSTKKNVSFSIGISPRLKGRGLTQNLFYTDGPGTKLYNGSVSAMTWTMGTDTRVRGYKYTYNGYGWLTAAEYGEHSNLGTNTNRYTERFLEFMPNGGVRRMQRHGLKADGVYGKVDMLLFPGGYATIHGTAVTFHYYTQDYLGNNRAVINGATGAIEQTVAYYPYGGVIADLGTNQISGQPYKFGGKELITANGLNEYDFGARQYYSAVPGFTRPDPMCEKYYWLSPYLYCGNNPVIAIDSYGCDIWSLDKSGHVISSQTFEDFDMMLVYDQNVKLKNNWRSEYGSIQNQSLRK